MSCAPTPHIKNRRLTWEPCKRAAPGAKTAAATGTPARITTTAQWFRKASIYGKATVQGAANTDKVWIGVSSVDGENAIEVLAGGEVIIEAPEGGRYNLADFYVDVAVNGEGVVVVTDADRGTEITA